MKKFNRIKKTGMLSSMVTLVVMAILVFINIAATYVTEKYPVTIDVTSNQIYKLSDESIEYIKNLETDIKITVLAEKDSFYSAGDYYTQAINIVDQYAKYSDKITIEYIDTISNPNIVSSYPDLAISAYDILVESGDKIEVITTYDLFNITYSSSDGSYYISSSNAETAMTTAILSVNGTETTPFIIVTGHGETTLSGFASYLTDNFYSYEEVNLSVSEIDPETKFIVVAEPQYDFTEEEIEKLDAYLMAGGNLIYFESYNQLDNLSTYLREWGISSEEGTVAEADTNSIFSGNPFFGMAYTDDTSLSGSMTYYDIPLTVPYSAPLTLIYENSFFYDTSTLLTYSEQSGIFGLDDTTIDDMDSSPYAKVAVRSNYLKGDVESNVLVFGSSLFVSDQFITSTAFSNAEYILNTLNTLCAKENMLTIAAKDISQPTVQFTSAQIISYSFIFIVLIPVVLIIFGITVWVRRKRR